MSDRIQELIDGIREKSSALHGQLLAERSKNQNLSKEAESLKKQVSVNDEEIAKLKSKVEELELKLKSTGEREVVVMDGAKVSDEQIDELVKEIEYCIAQLKK